MTDLYVIRNLPYNMEEPKILAILSQSFTNEQLQMVEHIQGSNRCYVKVVKSCVDQLIDFIDGRSFVNSRGIEERSVLEKVIFTLPLRTAVNNKHNNTVETSKTYQQFLAQLNTPEAPPPSLESLTDHLEKILCFIGLIAEVLSTNLMAGVERLAEELGAVVQDEIDKDTTHLIAARNGTSKVNKAEANNIEVVHSKWLQRSAQIWKMAKESDFPVTEKDQSSVKSKKRDDRQKKLDDDADAKELDNDLFGDIDSSSVSTNSQESDGDNTASSKKRKSIGDDDCTKKIKTYDVQEVTLDGMTV
eukprot:gene12048-14096_t